MMARLKERIFVARRPTDSTKPSQKSVSILSPFLKVLSANIVNPPNKLETVSFAARATAAPARPSPPTKAIMLIPHCCKMVIVPRKKMMIFVDRTKKCSKSSARDDPNAFDSLLKPNDSGSINL